MYKIVYKMVQVWACVESRELGRRSSTDVDALHAVGRDVLEAVEVR